MRHVLFDEKDRRWNKPSPRTETTYSFYDRSGLDEFARLRRMLQRWIDRLPSEKQVAFISRMRHDGRGSATEERNFQGAFFELFLHEFLLGAGGKVDVGPLMRGLTPDFGVAEASPEGTINYIVEATNVYSNDAFKSNSNEQYALDALDEIDCPDYFLWVETEGELTSTPSKPKLKRPFEELVKAASYDDVRERWERSASAGDKRSTPSATVRHGDWMLTGHLIPVGNRSKKGRFVGITAGKPGFHDDIGQIKAELEGKAKHYKGVENLIIA